MDNPFSKKLRPVEKVELPASEAFDERWSFEDEESPAIVRAVQVHAAHGVYAWIFGNLEVEVREKTLAVYPLGKDGFDEVIEYSLADLFRLKVERLRYEMRDMSEEDQALTEIEIKIYEDFVARFEALFSQT